MMNKRLKRLQYWLNRLTKACDDGRLDMAVMEADCLSAEVRETREHIWTELTEPTDAAKQKKSLAKSFLPAFKCLGIAMIIVLAATLPVAVDADRSVALKQAFSDGNGNTGHEMTVDKHDDSLHSLKGKLENNVPMPEIAQNIGSLQPSPQPAEASVKQVPAERSISVQSVKNRVQTKSDKAAQPSEHEVSEEEMFALIQAGGKAMKDKSSAIKIIRMLK